MSLTSRAARFLLEHVGKPALATAGTQIGEAIGKRVGAKIYTPPPEPGKADDGATGKP